jgi:AraC-like DNA-binding protein
MSPAVARYREYAPAEGLQKQVRALFSFTIPPQTRPESRITRSRITREIVFRHGQPFWSTLFADGHVSIVFSIGAGYCIDGLWHPSLSGPCGHVIGPMTHAQTTFHGERLEQAGAYLHAASSFVFTQVPAFDLADRVLALEDLWGAAASERLETAIHDAAGEAERVDCLEDALLERMGAKRSQRGSIDIAGIAASVIAMRGQRTVAGLARDAGVSRQHLTRIFRESVGVTPKLYCRLARFQAGLAYARSGRKVDWAVAALEAGYCDQSHMIADFRQFSGLTPGTLGDGKVFHPFIEGVVTE